MLLWGEVIMIATTVMIIPSTTPNILNTGIPTLEMLKSGISMSTTS